MTKIHKKRAELQRIAGIWPFIGALAAVLAACKTDSNEQPVRLCGSDGYLVGDLYGAIRGSFDLDNTEVACTGMPRPEGDGARLRFAGKAQPGDRQIAIIIAMPDLSPGSAGAELAANVTLIEEGNGRFFSTPDLDNCLVATRSVATVDDDGSQYTVSGTLYCVSSLPEVNGDSSVSIPELDFSGLLDWNAP